MPIPPFDPILNILPPHLGRPAKNPHDLSPFQCTIDEICSRFATSNERKLVLSGFLRFRFELSTLGVRGFQWLDGSFVENIEAQESRAPSDIDVVTIIENSDPGLKRALIVRPDLVNHTIVKATFAVDSFLIPCDLTPVQLIDHTRC